MKEITIYLTEEEAKQFVLFQKHRRLFEVLEKEGVFEVHNSSFQVHYDAVGKAIHIDLRRTIRMV